MSSQDDSLIEGVATKIDAQQFLDTNSIEERIELASQAAGQRLNSHQLAMLWADCLIAWSNGLDIETKQSMVREMLQLSPNHERAQGLLDALLHGRETPPRDDSPVFMIISCREPEHLARARALRQRLNKAGATAWIVIGDTNTHRPIWTDEGAVVSAPDTYEGLSIKVARGVEAIIARYGPCPIVKMDDSCELAAHFSVATLTKLAQQHDYVGMQCSDPLHDRVHHYGKTSQPMGVYARRFIGPWALGACYVMSARASNQVAREVVAHPGEFACEYYEDKAVGDCLRRRGVTLHPLASLAEFGLQVPRRGQPISATSQSAVTGAATPPRIPKQLNIISLGCDPKQTAICIDSWTELNPSWNLRVWTLHDLRNRSWANSRHIAAAWDQDPQAVIDLMRWELLYTEGGLFVDAQTRCVHALDDWLLESEAIACWQAESHHPRLIGCGMIGAVAENPFFGRIIDDLYHQDPLPELQGPHAMGSHLITQAYYAYQYTGLTILPSHFFIDQSAAQPTAAQPLPA